MHICVNKGALTSWKSEFLDSFSPFMLSALGTLLRRALGRLGGRKLVRRGRFGSARGRVAAAMEEEDVF